MPNMAIRTHARHAARVDRLVGLIGDTLDRQVDDDVGRSDRDEAKLQVDAIPISVVGVTEVEAGSQMGRGREIGGGM